MSSHSTAWQAPGWKLTCINTMEQALDVCEALDPIRRGEHGQRQRAWWGLAVDVHHVWWNQTLQAQIPRADKERLLAFHVCDWLSPTTDLLNDRGMMKMA